MEVPTKIYLYHGDALSEIQEEMTSLHKEEVIYFEKKVDAEMDCRIETLIDVDRGNFIEAGSGDECDSGNEDESFDRNCGKEGLARIKKIANSNSSKPNFRRREVCVIQSYILITSVGGGLYPLCHNCDYLCALEKLCGKHTHVNTHYKRSMECCNGELQCKVCKQSLYQLISPEVCVVCNKGQVVKIVNHNLEKAVYETHTGDENN